ncbi:MAG: YceI family protein [Alphaproteobacteria bacterium]
MIRFDQGSAECLVLTFKEGLLSAVAHDLVLRVERFTVEIDPDRRAVVGIFDAASLRVVDAAREGQPVPGVLGAAQKAEIESNVARWVLEPAGHPEIRYASTAVADAPGGGFAVDGVLRLHGVERPLSVEVRAEGAGHVARAVVHQPDFGIRPYSALLGTLRVRADVEVRLSLPGRT